MSPFERTADPTLTTNRFASRTAAALKSAEIASVLLMERLTVDGFAVARFEFGFRARPRRISGLAHATWNLELELAERSPVWTSASTPSPVRADIGKSWMAFSAQKAVSAAK